MLKSKYVLSALVLLVAMTMATATFAQGTFTVSSTPTSRANEDGHTEVAGNVTLALTGAIGSVATSSGTITITYTGVPITNNQSAGGAGPALEVLGTGCFAGTELGGDFFDTAADGVADIDVAVTQISSGSIVLTLGVLAASACAADDSIKIQGVRVSLSGSGLTQLNATVATSPGSNLQVTAGQDQPTVISSILDGLLDAGVVGQTTAAQGLSNRILSGTGAISFTVAENFIDALQDSTELGNGALNDTQIGLTFSGTALQSGVTITGLSSSIGTISPTTISSTVTAATVTFSALDVSLTSIDTMTITGTLALAAGTSALTLGTVDVLANLTPIGDALGTSNAVITPAAGNFPRYQTEPTATVNIANITTASTNLLIPYASVVAGFDTAISIANTTADNFTSNSALAQSGTILIEAWPQSVSAVAGTPFTYTTSATSPGSGLSATGEVASGDTYVVLLSEILAALPTPLTTFSGYIIVRTNFTNAHGSVYLTDFDGFTSAINALVIPIGSDRTTAAGEGLNN
jgi:hypothetical protein